MELSETLNNDEIIAKFCKALSHPVRISILRVLIEKGKCPCGCNPCKCGNKCKGKDCKCGCKCGELVDMFPMSQSTISQHIKELKNAGIIEITGRKCDYTLAYLRIREGMESLLSLFNWKNNEVSLDIQSHQTACNCEEEIRRTYKPN